MQGNKNENIFKKNLNLFCTIQKLPYLCIAFERKCYSKRETKTRAFSSAGSEHLPYKQRVGGSNPSTPTER